MDLKLFIFLVIAITVTNGEYKSFKDYKVYNVVPKTEDDFKFVKGLEKQGGVEFWSEPLNMMNNFRVMVAPEKQSDFEKMLAKEKIDTFVSVPDVQKLVEKTLERKKGSSGSSSGSRGSGSESGSGSGSGSFRPRSRSGVRYRGTQRVNRIDSSYSWNHYQTIEEIYEYLHKVAEAYPEEVTIINLGETVEGRKILGVKIDFMKRENATHGIIEGGIHAREWISPATATWIIKEFMTSNDKDVRDLAENVVWHIIPVFNPDGYSYTFTHNRMWRKNRNPMNNGSCAQWNMDDDFSNGVDLNRNFGFLWNTVGASNEPCSEVYAGPIANSEAETRAMINYVNRVKRNGRIVYYYAFHSYSQMVLIPYSHVGGIDVLQVPNYADLYNIAIKGMDKLKERNGTEYSVGTSVDILYPVSGSSMDWAKGGAEIPIAFLFELRDIGQYGFLLPPELIIDNNEEIMAALVEMDRVTRDLGYYSYSSGSRATISLVLVVLALFVGF